MAVACLAEVAQEMGAPISVYVDRVMPLVLKELASNRRIAAFCVGVARKFHFMEEELTFEESFWILYERWMDRHGVPKDLKKNAKRFDALKIIEGLFMNSTRRGTPSRSAPNMFADLTNEEFVRIQPVLLKQVLPVFLKALPLEEDYEESMTVYNCICSLILSSNPQILPVVLEVVHVFFSSCTVSC